MTYQMTRSSHSTDPQVFAGGSGTSASQTTHRSPENKRRIHDMSDMP